MREVIKKILREGKEEFTEEDLNNFMSTEWAKHKGEIENFIKSDITNEVKDQFESGKGIIGQFIDVEKLQTDAINIVTQNVSELVEILLKCDNEGMVKFLKDLIIKLKPIVRKELNDMGRIKKTSLKTFLKVKNVSADTIAKDIQMDLYAIMYHSFRVVQYKGIDSINNPLLSIGGFLPFDRCHTMYDNTFMYSSDLYNIKPFLVKTIEEIIKEIKEWDINLLSAINPFNESSNRKLIKKILKEDIIIGEEVTPEEVHKAADSIGMEWDDNKEFMDFSKKVTGKKHIDDMTSQERKKLIKKILKEGIGERSWTSEYDRMQWAIQDFESMVLDLYPYWWMNEVDSKKMFNSFADMNWKLRDEVYASIDKIHFYWKLAKEDFNDANLYYGVDWGDGYEDPDSTQMQNRKKLMIYTKKANPYVGNVIEAINDPEAIQLVR